MADISDVEDAVTAFVTAALYPAGASNASAIGSQCRAYRGWPNQATLNADLGAGVVNVTIVPENEGGRITTRYLPRAVAQDVVPGVAATALANTIIVSGNPTPGDVIGALIDGVASVYRIQAGDTVDLVAANLALAVQATRPALFSGATVTIPESHQVIVRCVADARVSVEVRRQEKHVRIISWCPSPQIRDTVCSLLDGALTAVSFLPLADMTFARWQYLSTSSYDQAQNTLLYRRDLVFSAEYSTIATSAQPSMLFGSLGLNDNTTFG